MLKILDEIIWAKEILDNKKLAALLLFDRSVAPLPPSYPPLGPPRIGGRRWVVSGGYYWYKRCAAALLVVGAALIMLLLLLIRGGL